MGTQRRDEIYMLYSLEKNGTDFIVRERFIEKAASKLGVLEKAIENWIANSPELLFPKEQVLVFAQSVAGQSMADVLALDSFGNLVVVEVKRDWSDRSTVSQLLEYAAGCKDCAYEFFNQQAKQYKKWTGGELIDQFRVFAERPDFPQTDLCKRQRVFIVAPESDSGLKKIIDWLRAYGVPIEFIPFRLFADDAQSPRFIDIIGVTSETEVQVEDDSWAGHWIFNTNETHCPGAYQKMFDHNVIAIYGYDNGGANLEGASPGQKVFAYVNGQGIRALGEVENSAVQAGKGIFLDPSGHQYPGEYHLSVSWIIRLEPRAALSNSEASAMGYSLPVRTVFGRLHRGRLAGQLEAILK
jgi:hypothetical protein